MYLKLIHKSIQKKLVLKPSLKNFKTLLGVIQIKFNIKKENILIYYFDSENDQILLMNNNELLVMFENENLINNFFVLYIEKRNEIFDIKKIIYYNILSRLFMNDFVRTFNKIEIRNNYVFFFKLKKLQKNLKLSKYKKKKLLSLILKEYEIYYLSKIEVDKKKFIFDFLKRKKKMKILNFKVVKKNQKDFLIGYGKKENLKNDNLAHSLFLKFSKKKKKKNFLDFTKLNIECISCQNTKFNLKKKFKVGFLCKECDLENRRKAYFLKR